MMAPGLVPHGSPPAFFTFPSLAARGLPHATTTRHFPAVTSFGSGAAPFHRDATELLRQARLDLSRVAYARQIHRADVAAAPSGGGFAGSADVLVTRDPGVAVAIATADCLAITLWDPEARVLVAAHVGWRGTVGGATQAAVGALVREGGAPRDVVAAIAPSIGPCCYEVDEPVIAELSRAYPDSWNRWVSARRPGRWMLDLWTANETILRQRGIPMERIENPRLCTACHPDLLYSYRKNDRGRLVTLAALP
jgi:purine-nucleoside/S-methyl-5'-thioadenosine phosphorylase / adenosine deaminase